MKLSDVTAVLDLIAPPDYAEPWDNVGLLVGHPEAACSRALLCIDLTAKVLDEAQQRHADLVVAYHPAIFKPIGRVTPQAVPIVWEAVRAGVAIYSPHTAYDVVPGGANDALADALGMAEGRRPLVPRDVDGPYKVVVFVPEGDLDAVSRAAFEAGAGRIGDYRECGFRSAGVGSFFGEASTSPAVGQPGRREEAPELRWETVCPRGRLSAVLSAIVAAHSYEEPAIDVYSTREAPVGAGLGRVGPLEEPAPLQAVLDRVKRACGVERLLLAGPAGHTVRTLAVGCGSCGSMYRAALAAGADLYVTGELRHHDALASAAGGLTVACVGHSNSERLTLRSLQARLHQALPELHVQLAHHDVDPFSIV